jgi:hypothetical protein
VTEVESRYLHRSPEQDLQLLRPPNRFLKEKNGIEDLLRAKISVVRAEHRLERCIFIIPHDDCHFREKGSELQCERYVDAHLVRFLSPPLLVSFHNCYGLTRSSLLSDAILSLTALKVPFLPPTTACGLLKADLLARSSASSLPLAFILSHFRFLARLYRAPGIRLGDPSALLLPSNMASGGRDDKSSNQDDRPASPFGDSHLSLTQQRDTEAGLVAQRKEEASPESHEGVAEGCHA